MKRKFISYLFIMPVLLCTGCSFFSLASLNDKVLSVCSLLGDVENEKTLDTYEVDNCNFKIKDGEEHLLYLSLQTYSDLIYPYLKDDYHSFVSDDGTSSVWAVTDPNSEYIFYAEINPRNKTIYCGGSLSEALTIGKDYSKSSLYAQMNVEGEAVRNGSLDGRAYYGNTSYKAYRRNGVTFYPLSLLDASFSSTVGIYHLYNYNRIIQFDEYEKLSDIKYIYNNQSMSAFDEMKAYISKNMYSMPSYLIEDRANTFIHIMDNYYGLAQTRKIGSMANYYQQQSYYNYFYSSNIEQRNEALYAAVGLLDDGHSAVSESETAPWFTGDYRYGGAHVNNMVKVRSDLKTNRESFYNSQYKEVGDILYSTSGELAFFSFDSFNFDEDAYLDDEHQTLKPDLYKTDSYFQFVNTFNQIKAHGGVKTIVIDISLNGGGVLGVMMKLLALLSKDNSSPIYLMDDSTMMVEKEVTSVDSNGDKANNINDCYGNSFNFAILTSGYSFSCGNAFPYYASKCGYAQIIGQRSAGGECTVEEAMLPSGEHFFHSSNLHIGYFDESKRMWEGDENGAPVDQLIEYSDFYNLDYLNQLLN